MTARDPQPGSYALGGTDVERERLVAQASPPLIGAWARVR
jgi:hypothetical protein